MDEESEVTRLLSQIRSGDKQAVKELLPIVYTELRRIAVHMMLHQPQGHTLQPTAVVHEAYFRLMAGATPDPANRAHFLAIAARSMRQVLVDSAKARLAVKRGGLKVELEEDLAITRQQCVEVLALHEALDHLKNLDPREAQIVEMHYFAGNSVEEIAVALEIAPRTVKRDLQTARLFLKRQLEGKGVDL